jgi:hypothetical protein
VENQHLSKKLFEIFPGLHRAYGHFFITERKGPKLDGYGKTIREKYVEDLWVEHLTGKTGLGVIPMVIFSLQKEKDLSLMAMEKQ